MTTDDRACLVRWSVPGRLVVFALAAASIACLLMDFYGLCPMRTFGTFILLPATMVLIAVAAYDAVRGRRALYRGVMIGATAGLVATVAYDVFRLPFVFAEAWGISSVVPPMPLFKVMPRFGAMLLGQPIEQPGYTAAAQLLGWAYHVSNGLTFGVMYLALVADAVRRHWAWAAAFSIGLELGMLFTPYPGVFSIHVGARFVIVTLAAHLVFGVAMGLSARRLALRARPKTAAAASG